MKSVLASVFVLVLTSPVLAGPVPTLVPVDEPSASVSHWVLGGICAIVGGIIAVVGVMIICPQILNKKKG